MRGVAEAGQWSYAETEAGTAHTCYTKYNPDFQVALTEVAGRPADYKGDAAQGRVPFKLVQPLVGRTERSSRRFCAGACR